MMLYQTINESICHLSGSLRTTTSQPISPNENHINPTIKCILLHHSVLQNLNLVVLTVDYIQKYQLPVCAIFEDESFDAIPPQLMSLINYIYLFDTCKNNQESINDMIYIHPHYATFENALIAAITFIKKITKNRSSDLIRAITEPISASMKLPIEKAIDVERNNFCKMITLINKDNF